MRPVLGADRRGLARKVTRVHIKSSTLLAAVALTLLQVAPSAQTTQRLFVAAVDASGAPVPDLTAADFKITENDVERTVTRAGLLTDPLRVALIVDTGEIMGGPIGEVRQGLTGFVEGLPEGTEVGLISTGRQARVRMQPTSDRKKQRDATSGLFPDGAGNAIMDGLLEAQRTFFRKVDNRWFTIVVVTSDVGAGEIREDEFNKFVSQMNETGVTVHGIVLSTRGGGTPTVVTLNATRGTGGRYEALAAFTALPAKLKELAAHLTAEVQKARSQYKIEYASDIKSRAGVKTGIGVARAGVTIRSSTRVPVK